MPLWLSLNRFALGIAVSKSGLSEKRFPEETRRNLQGMLHSMDFYGEHCFQFQDVLHAPNRKRAQEAVDLWSTLRCALQAPEVRSKNIT